MSNTRGTRWLPLFCGAVLALPAAAGELTLGGAGYAFTLRDTDLSEAPPHGQVVLGGLGWRAHAGLTFDGGARRVSVVVQRARDSVHESWGGVAHDPIAPLRFETDTGASFSTVDARYEPRVTASERFELRLQSGYRFGRATQTRGWRSRCQTCPTSSGWSHELRRTGHGLRVGVGSALRLVGPLHLEGESGLALLAVSEDAIYSYGTSMSRSRSRSSLGTWDVSARLRAEWKGVSVGVGYRFDRWTGQRSSSSDLGFDGFTFGLDARFGL